MRTINGTRECMTSIAMRRRQTLSDCVPHFWECINHHRSTIMANKSLVGVTYHNPTADQRDPLAKSRSSIFGGTINTRKLVVEKPLAPGEKRAWQAGCCENCGSSKHTRKDCLERPRKRDSRAERVGSTFLEGLGQSSLERAAKTAKASSSFSSSTSSTITSTSSSSSASSASSSSTTATTSTTAISNTPPAARTSSTGSVTTTTTDTTTEAAATAGGDDEVSTPVVTDASSSSSASVSSSTSASASESPSQ